MMCGNGRKVKLYLAPLENITGYIYRNAYHDFFQPLDKYFTPFIAAKQNRGRQFNYKEKNDILPENNRGKYVVPQILTNCGADFIRTARALQEYGYREVNLNLGCPSKPVVKKGRGSGFLGNTEALDRFLEEVFAKLDMKISVKTRLGLYEQEEILGLMEIFNRYPLEELIIHPRIRPDYYSGRPRMDVFRQAYEKRAQDLCYNGDIFTAEDFADLVNAFPGVQSVMIGRGILTDPALAGRILGKPEPAADIRRAFLERLLKDYRSISVNDEKALFKLKEIWSFMRYSSFGENMWEQVKQAATLEEYERAVQRL